MSTNGPCPECGSDLVTESTCPDGLADCFGCGAVFKPRPHQPEEESATCE